MSHQIWIRCPKGLTETVKKRLGRYLDRSQKLTPFDNVYLDIPTIFAANLGDLKPKFFYAEPGPDLPSTVKCVLKEKVPNRPPEHPVVLAVSNWLHSLPDEFIDQSSSNDIQELLQLVPKGWVVYHPMVILPPGSFQGEKWKLLLNEVRIDSRSRWYELWEMVLSAIQKLEGKGKNFQIDPSKKLTHLAVNAGIPLQHNTGHILTDNDPAEIDSDGNEDPIARLNILRSPTGLIMLYGDFGPSLCEPEDRRLPDPTEKDFKDAFWVSTTQNGIYQTWAPRYTMFSRGNIKEKARILAFHNPDKIGALKPEVDARRNAITKLELQKSTAVDLYAGIGYFAFSYAKMGIGRVVCWEINPWSIEGLRRGAVKNGWSVKVLNQSELDDLKFRRKAALEKISKETIVVFPESNEDAYDHLFNNKTSIGDVLHVNCGLLPSSQGSWEEARLILTEDDAQGWLHIHENAALEDVEAKKAEIIDQVKDSGIDGILDRDIEVEHVEVVKSFAPGVYHCVFDVWVGPVKETD